MRFSQMSALYERLDGTTKKLEKRDILADFYKNCDDLYRAVVLSTGNVFQQGEDELGVAEGMIKKVIARVAGASENEVVNAFKQTGDLGLVAERLMEKRKQTALIKKELTLDIVFDTLRKLPSISGQGSQDRKVELIAHLLTNSSPLEARYIVRIALGQMRIGVATVIIREAIAQAFGKEPKDVEHLFNMLGDYGRVAEQAKRGRMKAEIEMFRPIRAMLADRGGEDIRGAIEGFDHAAVEIKLDGFRTQIHKRGGEIKIFSRRMEDVTRQFPDIAAYAKESLRGDCIVDGEAID